MTLVIGLIAGLISSLIANDVFLAWLMVWPLFWLVEWIRRRWISAKALVIGYYFVVGCRIFVGLSIALIVDKACHEEIAVNRTYWFGWIANYLVGLIVETIQATISPQRERGHLKGISE